MNSRLDEEATYEVRVRGRLDESWSDWLNGVAMAFEDETGGGGITVLTGHFDQAALRGLLNRLWDLNLTVVSLDVRNTHLGSTDTVRGRSRAS
jgi:hypothetical protein